MVVEILLCQLFIRVVWGYLHPRPDKSDKSTNVRKAQMEVTYVILESKQKQYMFAAEHFIYLNQKPYEIT